IRIFLVAPAYHAESDYPLNRQRSERGSVTGRGFAKQNAFGAIASLLVLTLGQCCGSQSRGPLFDRKTVTLTAMKSAMSKGRTWIVPPTELLDSSPAATMSFTPIDTLPTLAGLWVHRRSTSPRWPAMASGRK